MDEPQLNAGDVSSCAMSTLEQRLKAALQERPGDPVGVADLARVAKVSYQAAEKWYDGRTKSLKSEYAYRLAPWLGVSVRWLATGEGQIRDDAGSESPTSVAQGGSKTFRPIKAFSDSDPLEDDEIEVPRLTLAASAGHGRLAWEIDEKGSKNRFRRDWCERNGYKPHHLTTMQVDGESMADTLHHGYSITVNIDDKRVRNGKIYVIDYQGEFYVKRMYTEPDGSFLVKSDNPDKGRYPDILIRPEHSEALQVLGRVVSFSGDL